MKCYRQNLPEQGRQLLPVAEGAESALPVGYRRNCHSGQCLPVTSPRRFSVPATWHTFCNSHVVGLTVT